MSYVMLNLNLLDLVTNIIVHFYTDFTFRFKQIWLFPYPYGFCNPAQIHGMKINMIGYNMIWYQKLQWSIGHFPTNMLNTCTIAHHVNNRWLSQTAHC
jgi:hypothetical protein